MKEGASQGRLFPSPPVPPPRLSLAANSQSASVRSLATSPYSSQSEPAYPTLQPSTRSTRANDRVPRPLHHATSNAGSRRSLPPLNYSAAHAEGAALNTTPFNRTATLPSMHPSALARLEKEATVFLLGGPGTQQQHQQLGQGMPSPHASSNTFSSHAPFTHATTPLSHLGNREPPVPEPLSYQHHPHTHHHGQGQQPPQPVLRLSPSSKGRLRSLETSCGRLFPEFSPDRTLYILLVDHQSQRSPERRDACSGTGRGSRRCG